MLDDLIHGWKRKRLIAAMTQLQAAGNRQEQEARLKNLSAAEVHACGMWTKRQALYRQIEAYETDWLLKRARLMAVVIPDENDDTMWENSISDKRWILTTKGQSVLRSALRMEQKERTEGWRLWLPAIAAGLSAIAAWVAVLRK